MKQTVQAGLKRFIPEEALQDIIILLKPYRVLLKVSKPRKTKLGDYRYLPGKKGHQISVNGDLNKYAFLLTLIHEIAHMQTFHEYGRKAKPHGKEWKINFQRSLEPFFLKNVFPDSLESAIRLYLRKNSAASCNSPELIMALREYDEDKKTGLKFVQDVPEGRHFQWRKGRVFKREKQLRKRIKCLELDTGKYYLFNPVAEVVEIPAKD